MAKQARQRSPQAPPTSLLPFFHDRLNRPYLGVAVAGAYGIAMLIVGLRYHVIGDYHVETDFYWGYVPEARAILSGSLPIEDFRGPFYPMLLAIAGTLVGDFFRGGIVLSTLAAALVLFFVHGLLKRLYRPDVALFGTLLVAANTTFVQYTYTAGTDMTFNALVTASTFFLLKNETREWKSVILAAVLAGAAYLTRYNGVYVLLAVPVVLLVVNPFGLEWRERFLTLGVYLGTFFLVISPWGVYCLIEKGSFFYNKNYLNIAYEMFAKGRITWEQFWNVDAARYESLTDVIFADVGLFARTVLQNIASHARGDVASLVGLHVGFFSLIGAVQHLKEKPTRRMASFYVVGAAFFSILLLVFYGERFSMFLLAVYAALAVRVLILPGLAKYRLWNRVQAGGVIGLLLVVWTAGKSYEFNSLNIDSGPKEILSIAEWYGRYGEPVKEGTVIIARKPHIAHYLGMRMELFPYVDTMEELRRRIREVNGSYLFYSYMEAGLRPQFRFLLDPRQAPAWLKAVTWIASPPAVLYRIEWQEGQ